jgi:predicted  nucleic acid-binding Zn-ribbon protein
MAETTDLEKKSLEAHVDLCAQRYRFLEQKLDTFEEKILALNTVIREVHDMVQNMSDKRNDQLINWGLGIVGTLVAVIAYLVIEFVIK